MSVRESVCVWMLAHALICVYGNNHIHHLESGQRLEPPSRSLTDEAVLKAPPPSARESRDPNNTFKESTLN